MVPVAVEEVQDGQSAVGLASSSEVDPADEEVFWVEPPLDAEGLHRQGVQWIIKEFFGHTFSVGQARWKATDTGAPNAAGVRELTLLREGWSSSARTSTTHKHVHDFLREIKFDESKAGIFEAAELGERASAEQPEAPPPVQLTKLSQLTEANLCQARAHPG